MCDILVLIGADGIVRSTIRSAGPSLGYQFGEKVGSSIYDLVHPEDRARTARVLTEVGARDGLSRPLEVRLLSSDGSWRRYEFADNLINDPKICGILVAARDVTARRLAEQSLVSQARILELIARRTSLAKVLIALAEEVQAELPNTLCSVLLLEGTGRSRVLRYAAAPTLQPCMAITSRPAER
jgi:PAS domain S-box-containing protein